MYGEFHRFFVVNVSSVVRDVAAASSWKALLDSQMSKYVLYVVASGNENQSLVTAQDYPAMLAEDYPNVISVGALDKTGTYVWENATKSQGSNTGKRVEILAPGEAVPCATDVIEGKAVYSIAPGTSFATPIVTAVAAILLEKGLSPIEVKARLLSTAIPLVKQRSGEPLARFGRLSVERALLNVGNLHLEYARNGSPKQFEAKAPSGVSIIKYQSSSDPTQTWTPVSMQDLLSVDPMPDAQADDKMFRLVFYDPSASDKIAILENVRLSGCFSVDARGSADKFLVMFGNACAQASQVDPDRWINDPSTIIAPRLGIARF
jgi:subtilisin family serine protease